MPRRAQNRDPAAPTSVVQGERYRRILRVARELTAAKGEDAVQMQEVARQAGVALNTLYRYFPSKAQLYAATLADELEALRDQTERRLDQFPTGDPVTRVWELIGSATDALLSRPLLAAAMLSSVNGRALGERSGVTRVDEAMREALLKAAGIENPTEGDQRMVFVILLGWSGALGAVLNGRLDAGEARVHLELLVNQMLKVRSTLVERAG